MHDRAQPAKIKTIEPLATPIEIPMLETERTLMRGWRQSDADVYAGWMADPEVSRYVGGLMNAEDAWRRMAMHAGHWQLLGYGKWAVERKEDHALLGTVGLFNPEGWPGIELGWTLAREAWGQGYAQETARAAIDWTWRNIDQIDQLISIIDPRNTASIRVAERLGMHIDREDELHGTKVLIYALERPRAAANG